MFKRNFLYALLGIAISSMIVPQAMARVCLLKSSSGVCLMYSGSVSCEDLNGSGAGNVTLDPKYMHCFVDPPASQPEVAGVVFCQNNGGNVAPGVNGFLATGFGGFATIYPGQVDSNGFAYGINVTATATAEQLATLNQFCQNSNWTAVDFVPAAMNVTIEMLDADGNLVSNDTETFACTLPNPETLGWDKAAGKPERRAYDCTAIN